MRRTRLISALAAVTLATLLGSTAVACGDDGDSEATADHNAADVSFLTEMIPHHQQAVQMVEMTEERDLGAEFVDLAEEIKAAQQPEVTAMQGWLDDWAAASEGGDEADPDQTDGSMSMGGNMAGMMTSEQLTKLAEAPDGSFRRLWLQSMIEHHQGAIAMAESELGAGKSPQALALAQSIKDTQTAEVGRLQAMLAR